MTPQEYELVLPDEAIQERVEKWCEGKLGEKVRGNVLERQKIVAELREQMEGELALEVGEGETEEEKRADFEARLKGEYDQAFELAIHHEVRRSILRKGCDRTGGS